MFSIDADQAKARLLRHRRRARGDLLGERLRRRDDDGLGARQQLAERDRDVAGARRHVDDKHVELAPVDVLQELLERPVQHRAAPHHRLVVVEEEADRHQLQVVRDRRDDHLVDDHRLLVDARACAGSSGRRCPRRECPPRARARRAPRRCWRSASTCRRRPCPTRPRSRVSSAGSWTPRGSAPPRSFVVSAARSSGVITSNESVTEATPGSPPTCSATCVSKLERSGQPTTVNAIVTDTSPPSISIAAHHVELGDRAPQLRVDHPAERFEDLLA